MIRDNTPHRIFKISELTRLIASHLIPDSHRSAISLACTCRYLEEPVLSTLWENQSSLDTLLEVLPDGTWDREYPARNKIVFRIVGDPPPEAWDRVRRYACWMRRVRIGEWSDLGEDTLLKLRLNLPPGGWFPALQVLSWCITEANLPYVDLFLSPHLKKISIRASWLWDNSRVPQDILPAIASTISTLPTSSLQSLMVGDHRTMPWAYFKDSFSSVVLRCGPSFTEYVCPVPLSDAAVNHLMQLPHLCIWRTHGPPPNYPLSSLPLVFPPLKKLTLAEGAAHGWLSLYRRLWDGTSTTQDVTPLDNVKKSLDSLEIDNLPGLIVDASFVSPIQMFCNMVHLNMAVFCHGANDAGRCTFKLNNDDVAKLTAALPQLKSLRLGTPCFENACATTVACLLPISVHCVQLESLEVHFNTTNIVADFMNISEDPRFQQLRSLPRCLLLTSLDVYRIPLTLDEACVETVAKGMIDIFPSLTYCEGVEQGWDEVSRRIVDLQEDELRE